jgi:hypothetical protein
MAIAANTELPATARFSARMDPELSISGDAAMKALSPLTSLSANTYSRNYFRQTLPTAVELCARIFTDPFDLPWRNH